MAADTPTETQTPGPRPLGARPAVRAWALSLAGATALGVFLGTVGPFGSFYNSPISGRIAYWVGVMWLGTATYGVTVTAALALARRWRIPDWAALTAGMLLAAAPLALVVQQLIHALYPRVRGLTLADFYSQVLVISAPVLAIVLAARWLLGAGAAGGRRAEETKAAPDTLPLPAVMGREVICLQMEDHYVRIHTRSGSTLALGALQAAMAAVKDVEGMQTHRSWWVARAAVRGQALEGRNLRLILANGLSVPVARAQVGRLRAAGWLAN